MIEEVMNYLTQMFPNPKPELNYENDFQCLVAVMLSAQCTDKRVNEVTATLFKEYPDSFAMASLSQSELEKLIFSTGFYHNKAKNVLAVSKILNEQFNGKVPTDPTVLESLPGWGERQRMSLAVHFLEPTGLGLTHTFLE